MKISEKSVAYAFIANGIQLYTSDEEDFFVVSRLVCKDCNSFWYMNLTECFLCGAINPFLFQCQKCGTFQSITKSSHHCSNCDSESLNMACPNINCLSNKDKKVSEEANKFKGVFNKDSGLLISQQYCLKCGSRNHKYKSYEIHVRDTNDEDLDFSKLSINKDKISSNSYLLVKCKIDGEKIKYGLYKLNEIIDKKLKMKNLKNKFSEIVEILYPD